MEQLQGQVDQGGSSYYYKPDSWEFEQRISDVKCNIQIWHMSLPPILLGESTISRVWIVFCQWVVSRPFARYQKCKTCI